MRFLVDARFTHAPTRTGSLRPRNNGWPSFATLV
jgi:hypothetical protein